MRYALKVFYYGLNFYGSQIQKDKRTVEGVLIETLKKLGYDVHNFKRASRTDRKVSALQNVFAFSTNKELNIEIINRNLPDDIRILAKAIVPEDFNPRYNVLEKTYKYFLFNDNYNVEKMREAAKMFIGKHDFYNFCIRKGLKKSTIKNLKNIDLEIFDDIIILTFRSKSFLRGMIRKIVTALKLVGEGKLSKKDIEEALNRKKDLKLSPAPAEYLVLWDIKYKDVSFEYDEKVLNDVKRFIIKNYYSKYKLFYYIFKNIIEAL